jgi:uncharacterized membrane protein YcfT
MRLAWADVARGVAMILVVFAHAVQLLGAYGWQLGILDTANLYLTAIRMPLFFLVAGIFAATAIRRSWPALFASKLALLIYVYVLWGLVRAVWFSFVPWPLDGLPSWLAFLASPVWPTNGLWFLYALVLYLCLGKATARVPAWAVLAVAGATAVVAAMDLVPTGGNDVWRSIAMYAFFFLCGARLRDVWTSLAARANIRLMLAGAVAVVASVAVFPLLPDALRGVGRITLSLICVVAALLIAAMVARVRPLSAPLEYVGRRTLPIYVMHTLLLAAIVPLVPVQAAPAAVVVVLLVAVGTLVPLGVARLTARVSGIFTLPSRVARRLQPLRGTTP